MSRRYPNSKQDCVRLALQTIRERRETDRAFDSCFERGTASNRYVAARVYAEALKDAELMRLLPRYLDVPLCAKDYGAEFGTPLFAETV